MKLCINYLHLILCTALLAMPVKGQESITLAACYEWAHTNYPLIRQYELIDQTEQYNLSNAGKGWLPQLAVQAKATYQSDVTKLPFDAERFSTIMPDLSIPTLNRNQYQVVAELSQTVWDGGAIHASREWVQAGAAADRKQLESDLYALNDRVNQLYFGCLLQDELLRQNALLQRELHIMLDRLRAMMDNGMANLSDCEKMEAELLNTRQRETELKANRAAYGRMLGILINRPLGDSVYLIVPSMPGKPLSSALSTGINRPELQVLDMKSALLGIQHKQVTAGLMPRVGVFVQGGYGRPGLNMLENSFEPFYVAGLRISWNMGALYTLKNDRRKIEVNRRLIDVQRETFLFNTRLQAIQQHAEVRKMAELLETDDEIVRLRTSIKKATEAKLANGVISVTDLIREINAEDQAKQTVATHRMQQLMSVYHYMYTTNNNP
ncbi:MAG: TolC family protein [Tannerellaceae bacterium]|jgi:outer membrane protein TolC|nr:TolC family protein [Tannerellaceae bacterium]